MLHFAAFFPAFLHSPWRSLLLTLLLVPAAFAQQPPAAVEAAVLELLQQETRGLPGRAEISLRPFEASNALVPCAAPQAFLPAGSRAWGQVKVGVRCDAPTAWTVWVQASVRVFGPYLVSTRALRSAQQVRSTDVEVREGELSALPANVLSATDQAVGQLTRFAIAADTPLRASALRPADSVRRGQTVTIVTSGAGFSVSAEAQALNNAAPGTRVRLRLANGQIVHGVAAEDGSVKLDP